MRVNAIRGFDHKAALRRLIAPLAAPLFILAAVADIQFHEQMAPTLGRFAEAAKPLLARFGGS